jgi:hypothetical protein
MLSLRRPNRYPRLVKINKERSHAPLSLGLSSVPEKPHCLILAQIAPAITISDNWDRKRSINVWVASKNIPSNISGQEHILISA